MGVSAVHRITGSLYSGVNPADLQDSSTDYGGTKLGIINRIGIRLGLDHARIFGAEFAKDVEALFVERNVEVAFALRDYHAKSINTLFPNTALGAVNTTERVILLGNQGTLKSGQAMAATKAGSILFAADRPELPSFILYNALPLYEDKDVPISYSFRQYSIFRMRFAALPDTSVDPWRVGAMGPVADLEGL